jgi:hypothetical protein
VLTGTPLENRLEELHGILEFLDPKALGAPWKIIPTYATLNEEGRITGYTRLDQLRGRLSKFLIRRSRPEVLSQLPPRTDNSFWTPITPDQKEVHAELSRGVRRIWNKWLKWRRLTREDLIRLFMLLTGMRIVCNAYGQYDWKNIQAEVLSARRLTGELKARIGSPKLEEFRKVLADLLAVPGQKVLVFSQWERMLRLAELYVRDVLDEASARAVFFTGSLSLKKREAQIRRFKEDPSTRVFLSTDAGGVGLNLQDAAACVVNLEIPWNPAVLEQRVGRVHRMGQRKSVQVVNMVSGGCIEQGILGLVGQKKALFAGVFDPATSDIRFTPDQTASFMEKMRAVLPALTEPAPEPSAADAGAARDGDEEGGEVEVPAALADAAGDKVAPAPPVPEGVGPGPSGVSASTSGRWGHLEVDSAAAASQPAGKGAKSAEHGARSAEHGARSVEHGARSAAPTAQFDLAPALAALAGLMGQSHAPRAPALARIREDSEGVHLSLPKPAVEMLRGLRPLLEGLLALAGPPATRGPGS